MDRCQARGRRRIRTSADLRGANAPPLPAISGEPRLTSGVRRCPSAPSIESTICEDITCVTLNYFELPRHFQSNTFLFNIRAVLKKRAGCLSEGLVHSRHYAAAQVKGVLHSCTTRLTRGRCPSERSVHCRSKNSAHPTASILRTPGALNE